jgi:ABC-2 type transport system permease protein
MFQFVFPNMSAADIFSSIPIAVVDNEAYKANHALQAALKAVSSTSEGRTPFFILLETTADEAEHLLEEGNIVGYVLLEPDIQLAVKSSGIKQTILKSFLDQYSQTASTLAYILHTNPAALQQGQLTGLFGEASYLQNAAISSSQPDATLILFYALLAMASLQGAFWGIRIIREIQADQSLRGARVNLAPVHKLKLLGCDILAVFIIQTALLLVLLGYMALVLNVAFGSHLGYILLTCLAGSLTGISMGTCIAALIKGGEGVKIGLVIGANLGMSLFSGLYYPNFKHTVSTAFPPAAWVNPANLITDALYSLYYYDTYKRFFLNIGLLFSFSALFLLGSYLVTRRNRYASIPSLLQDN